MARTKSGISAVRLAQESDQSHHRARGMRHTRRSATAQYAGRYALTGSLAMDDAYFRGTASGKSSRCAANKTSVLATIEESGEGVSTKSPPGEHRRDA